MFGVRLSRSGSRLLTIVIDSEGVASVMPRNMFADIAAQPSNGMKYRVASGTVIDNQGVRTIPIEVVVANASSIPACQGSFSRCCRCRSWPRRAIRWCLGAAGPGWSSSWSTETLGPHRFGRSAAY